MGESSFGKPADTVVSSDLDYLIFRRLFLFVFSTIVITLPDVKLLKQSSPKRTGSSRRFAVVERIVLFSLVVTDMVVVVVLEVGGKISTQQQTCVSWACDWYVTKTKQLLSRLSAANLRKLSSSLIW